MSRLADFFSVQAGSAGNFSFTDPWDGTVYPNCHFEDDEMTIRLNAENQLKTTLTVRSDVS